MQDCRLYGVNFSSQYLDLLPAASEPCARAGLLLLWYRNEVQASQEGVPLLWRVLQNDIVHHMVINFAIAVQLEGGDAIKDAFCVPRNSGNAMNTPPHSASSNELNHWRCLTFHMICCDSIYLCLCTCKW